MKRRQLVLIGVLLAGAVLLYLPRLLSDSEGRGSLSIPDGFSFQVSEPVTRVDVVELANGRTFRLERAAPEWTVDGHRADMPKIETMLTAIGDLSSDAIVARNPTNHEALGVGDSNGRRIDVYTEGGGPYSFHLGDRDLGAGGYFVRVPDSAEVFRLDGPVGGFLSRDRDGWRQRVIARVNVDAVRDIMIRRSAGEIVIRREDDGWSIDGRAADSSTVQGILALLPAVSASDFPTDEEAAAVDFSTPDAELDVFAEGGTDVTDRELVLGLRFVQDTAAGDWLVRTVDGSEVYRLAPFTARRLIPERTELLPE
ncbi:MAG: DUF4340 domain-containing protein [Gemmatimonadota bacterium]|nr:DUF4340 domain-containing protein [Gemmatimonadota bacterium]